MKAGDPLSTSKPVRSQRTGMFLPREGIFVRGIENLGRKLILVNFGVVGKVPNLAYRLCEEANSNQILINEKTLCKVENFVEVEPLEKLQLKGFPRPIAAFNIVRCKL